MSSYTTHLRAAARELLAAADAFDREQPARPRPFSQVDGERPPGCGRRRFLAAWRSRHATGDPGASAEGRARILSPDAWARFIEDEAPRAPLRLVSPAQSPSMLDRLGARRLP
jgi:hypothetical protein